MYQTAVPLLFPEPAVAIVVAVELSLIFSFLFDNMEMPRGVSLPAFLPSSGMSPPNGIVRCITCKEYNSEKCKYDKGKICLFFDVCMTGVDWPGEASKCMARSRNDREQNSICLQLIFCLFFFLLGSVSVCHINA